MAILFTTLQETPRLPWINAASFGLQMLFTCIGLVMGDASDMRTQTDTLVTPAAYAFSIWNGIYLLCMVLLLTDISYAGLSFYDSAAKPNALRLCFGASCVANGIWCVVLANGHVVGASLLVSLLWMTLLPLYIFASYERKVRTMLWLEYLCSELCIRVYFAWITVEAVVSWTITFQNEESGYLQLSTYLTLLSLLLVAALSGLCFGRDPVLALVVAWALVGIVSREISQFKHQELQDFVKVQAAATLGAGVLVAMVLVFCSSWIGQSYWYGRHPASQLIVR